MRIGLKSKFTYLFMGVAIIMVASLVSCQDQELITSQSTVIEKYLEGNLRLEYYSGFGVEPDGGYYTRHNGAYRYIETNVLPAEEQTFMELAWNDEFEYDFAYYMIQGSMPDQRPFYASWWDLAGIAPPADMPLDSRTTTLGSNDILKSVEEALPECQHGDMVHIFLTSDKVYAGEAKGMVPANTPIMCTIIIRNITKNN